MYRDEAIQLMCNTIDEFNRFNASAQGITSEQIEEFITSGRAQLEYVNGLLYDTLKNNGVIV